MGYGTRWTGLVLAVGVAITLSAVVPCVASASPLVQGESLGWCGLEFGYRPLGHMALSGDGNTAISGECVYVRSGKTWTEQGEVGLPANRGTEDFLSFDGNTLIAEGEFGGAQCCENRVLARVGAEWVEQEPVPGGQVRAVSGDASTVLVEEARGVINVEVRSGEGWKQQATLKITPVQTGKKGEEEVRDFGFGHDALTGDGNLALIEDSSADKGKGGVFIFTRSDETWSQGAALESSKGVALSALSENGSTALMYVAKKGWAVWTRSGETYVQQGPLLSAQNKKEKKAFPEEVVISGNGNAALACAGDREYGNRRGHPIPEIVYVFERSEETWSLTQTLTNPGGGGLCLGHNFAPHVDVDYEGNVALVYDDEHEPPFTTTWTR